MVRSYRLARPRDLLLALGLFAPLLGVLLAAGIFSVHVLNGVRAYVAGEGYWSEGVQHAVFHLDRYAERGDLRDYESFRAGIHHPLALKRARLEMERPRPDFDHARQELIAGGIHPDDIDMLIRLFRHLGHVGALQEAISVWRESDEDLIVLNDLGTRIHNVIEREGAGATDLTRLRAELIEVRERLRDHGLRFSETMGEGARWAVTAGTVVLVGTALLLFAIGTTVLLLALRRIRRSESALLETQERYRTLVDESPYGIFALGREGTILQVNPVMEAYLGRSRDELVGTRYTHVVSSGDRERAAAAFDRLNRGESESEEVELRVDGGTSPLLNIVAVPDRRAETVTGVHGIAIDVTESRQQEERVHLLATALSSLREEGVAIIREDGSYVYSNDAHARIYGYSPGDPPEEGTFAVTPSPELRAETERIFAEALAQGGWTGRIWRHRFDDRRLIPIDVILAPITDRSDTLYLSIVRDVSEDVARERELRRAERLRGLARLVGGVAHELNNPLTSIRGFAELLQEDEQMAAGRADLQVIRREADRAAKIVQDLRLIARKGRERTGRRRAVTDVGDVVRHVVRVRSYADETNNITLDLNLPDTPLTVQGEEHELEQVFLNLVQNAEDALQDAPSDRRIEIAARAEGDDVLVMVCDNGRGIPPEDQDRLFDPFWTTRENGTGLGLPIVEGIVHELGGAIEVSSRSGGPTVFSVRLPQTTSEPPAGNDSSGPTRHLRILVVDDEPHIRATLRRFLTRRGHTVEEAAEGGEALRRIRASELGDDQPLFDVILTDLRMPGIGGEQLLAHLTDELPELAERIVFITGDSVSEAAADFVECVSAPVLLKPFDLEELARIVEAHGSG